MEYVVTVKVYNIALAMVPPLKLVLDAVKLTALNKITSRRSLSQTVNHNLRRGYSAKIITVVKVILIKNNNKSFGIFLIY